MRIGLVSTVSTPVRRDGSDSVETIVWLLARELIRMGHEVTLFASAGSQVDGARMEPVAGTYGAAGMPLDYLQCEVLNLVNALGHATGLDVLHSHGYLLGRLFEVASPVPIVHTLHTQPYAAEAALMRLLPTIRLTALSHFQWSAYSDVDPTVVAHAADPGQFRYRARPERRLCWLGRFLPGKGPLEAIRIAHELDLPLVIAGPENEYFREVVRPHVDGNRVDYAGAVHGPARDELLGGSLALLYPLTSPEPFGLVMIEAMLCGTPVLASRLGAVPEVVEEGVTGCVAPLAGLAAAGPSVFALDRSRVRASATARFSLRRMALGYEAAYRTVLGNARAVPERAS